MEITHEVFFYLFQCFIIVALFALVHVQFSGKVAFLRARGNLFVRSNRS